MKHPDVGMHYEDCRNRAKRINKHMTSDKQGNKPSQARIIDSLLNQASLNQGKGARQELEKELNHKRKYF